jgi:hypothetical protein
MNLNNVKLDSALLVGGKMFNCISAIKITGETEAQMKISTVFNVIIHSSFWFFKLKTMEKKTMKIFNIFKIA